jgi:aromatic-L-amino-acid decarboxylase
VFRYYGHEGVVSILREGLRLARLLKQWIDADSDFELAAPVELSLVCFRHRAGDEFNRRLLAEINASGKALLSHTVLNGRYVLRFAIGNMQTSEADVRETWASIQETASRLGNVRLDEGRLGAAP